MPPATSNFTRTLGILVGDAINVCTLQGTQGVPYGAQVSVVEDGASRDRVYRAEVKTSGNPEGWHRLVPSDHTESGMTWALDVSVDGMTATFRLVRSGSSLASTVLKCKVMAYSGPGGSVAITGSTTTFQGATNAGTYEGALLTRVDGKVGIGTDTPTETLDVKGNVRVSGNVTLQGLPRTTTGNAVYVDVSTGKLSFGEIVANGVDQANVYTKTQLDGGQLDSRYYTETEVNTLLNIKANVANAQLTGTTSTDQLTANTLTVNGNVSAGNINAASRLSASTLAVAGSATIGGNAFLSNLSENATGNALYVDTATGLVTRGPGFSTLSTSTSTVVSTNVAAPWVSRTSVADNHWHSVTWGNGLFVAVSIDGNGNRVQTSPDGISWTSRSSAANYQWFSVTYGNGHFVAVSYDGANDRVMTSPDGITWTSRSANDFQWVGVTYGNGLFVAVSPNGGGAMTSSDGINWTLRTSAASYQWTSVTYGNGLFVAVATTGFGNRVMTSPDGINWTSRTSAADNQWRSVTYGDGLFVAVSTTGTGNRVMTSPDGITWTSRTSAADNDWRSVTYGNGRFVAVSTTGSGNRVMTFDYVTETSTSVIVTGLQVAGFNVSFSNPVSAPSLLCTGNLQAGNVSTNVMSATAMSANTLSILGNVIAGNLSTNTISATAVSVSNLVVGSAAVSGNVALQGLPETKTGNAVYIDASTGQLSYGKSSADTANLDETMLTSLAVLEESATGLTVESFVPSEYPFKWTLRTSAADNSWWSVAYGNGLFVAVAITGSGDRVMTSPDGITWTSRTSAADNEWRSVTWGNGLFVAVSSSGTGNRVMTSPDGITWTSRTSAADNSWRGVTYGNGLFVAVSSTGTGNRVMTSPDGVTWTSRTSAANNTWIGVAWGNGLFVAVSYDGSGNRVMTSPDGVTWTIRQSAADDAWNSVTYGDGLFVAVSQSGSGNRVMTSPDGITWTSRTSAADNQWSSVTYGNGLFVAVSSSGSGNRVMTSPDGITWTLRSSAANDWRGVTYGNGLFVAVSIDGSGKRVMTWDSNATTTLSPNVSGVMYYSSDTGLVSYGPIASVDVSSLYAVTANLTTLNLQNTLTVDGDAQIDGTLAATAISANSLTTTGNVLVNGNTLVVNAVTNRVGINTNAPSQALDVVGNVRATGSAFLPNLTQNTAANAVVSVSTATGQLSWLPISGGSLTPTSTYYSNTLTADVSTTSTSNVTVLSLNNVTSGTYLIQVLGGGDYDNLISSYRLAVGSTTLLHVADVLSFYGGTVTNARSIMPSLSQIAVISETSNVIFQHRSGSSTYYSRIKKGTTLSAIRIA